MVLCRVGACGRGLALASVVESGRKARTSVPDVVDSDFGDPDPRVVPYRLDLRIQAPVCSALLRNGSHQ